MCASSPSIVPNATGSVQSDRMAMKQMSSESFASEGFYRAEKLMQEPERRALSAVEAAPEETAHRHFSGGFTPECRSRRVVLSDAGRRCRRIKR